jgi:hypothetical protein
MDFIKKHYEKVLLGVVLLLATGAVAALPFLISSEKATLEEQRTTILKRPVKPLTNLDLTISETVVKNLGTPLGADFSLPHNVLNPVQWQKGNDNRLIKLAKGNEIGPEAAVVTKTTPLYLILSLDSVGPSTTGSPSGYLIGIEKQASTAANARRKRQTFAAKDAKKDDFTLREVKGPPENPTELIVELGDTGDRVSLSKEKPYKRVDGYLADVRYDPEKKNYANRRVDDQLVIAGETYKIVAITQNEVVVSHTLTGKKFTIRTKAENSQS